jgi:hypothetical protein
MQSLPLPTSTPPASPNSPNQTLHQPFIRVIQLLRLRNPCHPFPTRPDLFSTLPNQSPHSPPHPSGTNNTHQPGAGSPPPVRPDPAQTPPDQSPRTIIPRVLHPLSFLSCSCAPSTSPCHPLPAQTKLPTLLPIIRVHKTRCVLVLATPSYPKSTHPKLNSRALSSSFSNVNWTDSL